MIKRILSTLLLLITLPVMALQNGQALTPPMGWNTWYKYTGAISETMIHQMSDAMVSSGLLSLGYNYMLLDDCWMGGRSATAPYPFIADGTKFPSGMAALATYIHGDGLKAGIYSAAGVGGYCTAFNGATNIVTDANTFANWGYDFLKYDGANLQSNVCYRMMTALSRTNSNIVFSLSDGYFEPWMVGIGNMFRISPDENGTWANAMNTLDMANGSWRYSGPGHWCDLDVLQIDTGDSLTTTERQSQFSMWCITASPLILGMDVRTITAGDLAIVGNTEMIAVDQDSAGVQGHKVQITAGTGGNLEVWVKPLGTDGTTKAVAFFNRSTATANITAYWTNIDLAPGTTATARDLWAHSNLGTVGPDSYTVSSIASHACVVIKLVGTGAAPTMSLADYLPVMPQGTYRQYKNVSAVITGGGSYQYPLTTGGTNYPKGFGVLAPSKIDIDLTKVSGTVTAFASDAKINDHEGSSGSVDFQIWGDGILLSETGTLTGSSAVTNIYVPCQGVHVLSLVVTNLSGTPNVADCADWGDPRLYRWPVPSVRVHR